MKRTEKGIVRRRYWQTDPDYCIESPEGQGWYPANQLWGFLRDHEDREVEVTIEANRVEPIGLRERVAKIFDEMIKLERAGKSGNYSNAFCAIIAAKQDVLAEIDKERQAK